MKYLFLVQGEGRGHMTQALSLYSLLKDNGHEVMGASKLTQQYMKAQILFSTSNTKAFKSPVPWFIILTKVPVYFKSIEFVHSVIKERKPDVIINFYDQIGGLCNFLYPHKKYICVGHQFRVEHPKPMV